MGFFFNALAPLLMTSWLPAALLSTAALSQTRLNGRNLLREDANFRAEHVRDVKYEVSFDLRAADQYRGQSVLHFRLSQVPQFLTVDFVDGEVQKLVMNGKNLDVASHNGSLILLKQESLAKGDNTLVVDFVHPYSKTGNGLYRFVDPEDKRVYLYTNLEPYDANNVFPCFDQPNLKATYKISVVTPPQWTVVTSTRETTRKLQDRALHWDFPESQKFSTYVFSLHAGPYKIWESKAGDVPLRVLARQSLAKHIKADFWFTVSRQGLEFFKNYFGVAYPFKKYDQVIVPDFNSGAMENVGAVTFSERYIKRGKANRTDQFQLANVILHEMSHMWFGNLVTMQWWGDLWLNETFATAMSYLAMHEATEFSEAWKVFAASEKAWAIWEDQMPTTHPVRAQVSDTDGAYANFDGITYAKGAAVMRQMAFVMGEKAFQRGLKEYFDTHAFQNASFEDFMASLEKSSGQSLSALAHEWLETAGLNNVRTQWSCVDGKLGEVKLLQTLTQKEQPILRQHKAYLAFFRGRKNGSPELLKQQEVTYTGAESSVLLSPAIDCPDLVYPNYQDKDFVQVSLDLQSLEFVKKHLSEIRGSHELDLLRNSLWENLWDDASNARLPLATYLEILSVHLPQETEANALETSLDHLGNLVAWTPTENGLQKRMADRIEDFLRKSYVQARPGSDAQQIFFDAWSGRYWNQAQGKQLESLLKQKDIAPRFSWDPDRRWTAIESLCRGRSDCTELIKSESQRDGSRNGKLAALRATAAQKNLTVKKKIYEELVHSPRNASELKAYLRGLWSWNQGELQEAFKKTFFEQLLLIQEKNDDHFTSAFARYALPLNCDKPELPALTSFLETRSESLRPGALRSLKISKRTFERCQDIRKVSLATEASAAL